MGSPASGWFRGGGFYSILDVNIFVMCLPNSSLQVAEFVSLVRGLPISYFEGFGSVSLVGIIELPLFSLQSLSAYKEKLNPAHGLSRFHHPCFRHRAL